MLYPSILTEAHLCHIRKRFICPSPFPFASSNVSFLSTYFSTTFALVEPNAARLSNVLVGEDLPRLALFLGSTVHTRT